MSRSILLFGTIVFALLGVALALVTGPSVALQQQSEESRSISAFLQSSNSDTPCIVCTLAMKTIENLAFYKEKSIEKAVSKICDYVPQKQLATACKIFISLYGNDIIRLLAEKQTPDVVCQKINLCKNKQCVLFPKKPKMQADQQQTTEAKEKEAGDANVDEGKSQLLRGKFKSWWKDLFEQLFRTFNDHIPLMDSDKDGFSTAFGFRGSAWRGRDCDNTKSDIYPGRRLNRYGPSVDHNCNGIKGVNPATGKSWEDELCANTGVRGVAVLGDSAAAHFRIPEQWILPQFFSRETFAPLLTVAETEFDWPHLSYFTGYMEQDPTGLTPGVVDSIYMRLRKRNRCVHRDYQNIAVNGARTGAMQSIAKTMSRNSTADVPLIVFYALVGNDVCSPHHTTDNFTPPERFYNNVVGTLDHLETVLPPNSTVIFVGLADGGILYKSLHDKMHPIGTTYANMYDYLNCLEMNPCWAWMNTNETIRDMATKHAHLLSGIYPKIIAERGARYRNFKMFYHDFPMYDVIKRYPELDVSTLIEPMDGFHPSHRAMPYLAEVLWTNLEKQHPNIFGPVNPNNAKIEELFGNQGGY